MSRKIDTGIEFCLWKKDNLRLIFEEGSGMLFQRAFPPWPGMKALHEHIPGLACYGPWRRRALWTRRAMRLTRCTSRLTSFDNFPCSCSFSFLDFPSALKREYPTSYFVPILPRVGSIQRTGEDSIINRGVLPNVGQHFFSRINPMQAKSKQRSRI
jgi:hypothetical protein